jgi:enoyl-CoA hydratase
LRIGLINKIVAREELEATVRDYAKTLGGNAPLTIKAVKATIRELLRDPEKRDLEKINQLTQQCFDSKDYAEGRRAFMEKRKPVFRGE